MGLDYNTHHPIKGQAGDSEGFRVTPYLWISSRDEGTFLIQGGKIYDTGGTEVLTDEVPDWVWKAIDGMNDQTRESVGIARKVAKGKEPERASITPPDQAKLHQQAPARSDPDSEGTLPATNPRSPDPGGEISPLLEADTEGGGTKLSAAGEKAQAGAPEKPKAETIKPETGVTASKIDPSLKKK